MLDLLWQIFLGSLIVLAIALVWVVIAALVVSALKRRALPLRITVRNTGQGTMHLIEVRNVTTGKVESVGFELEPGFSKTVEVSA